MSEHHGKVWWTELNTFNPKGALEYYEKTCGWVFEATPMAEGQNDYYVGMLGETPMAGIFDMTGVPGLEGVPSHWLSYFAVTDVDTICAQTEKMGGLIKRPPFDVPMAGRIAIVQDPVGAIMGMMTPNVQNA